MNQKGEIYLTDLHEKLQVLLCEQRDYYKIDLHQHSNYSADGKDTVEEILDRAVRHHFDVISITDHDDVQAIQAIIDKDIDTKGIIVIPGVEFSVYNRGYGSMLHVLQYGFNPYDKEIIGITHQNQAANRNRFFMQCELIKKNAIYTHVFNTDSNFNIAEEILNRGAKGWIPDYIDIAEYIYESANRKGLDLYALMEIYENSIDMDVCTDRQKLNYANLDAIRKRIASRPYNDARILKKIIANSLTEDALFKDAEPVGNISISNYGQIAMDQISHSIATAIAHPVYESFLKVDPHFQKCFDMVEKNYANKKITQEDLSKIKDKLGAVYTIGSDYHYDMQNYYSDNNFFMINFEGLKNIVDKLLKKRGNY